MLLRRREQDDDELCLLLEQWGSPDNSIVEASLQRLEHIARNEVQRRLHFWDAFRARAPGLLAVHAPPLLAAVLLTGDARAQKEALQGGGEALLSGLAHQAVANPSAVERAHAVRALRELMLSDAIGGVRIGGAVLAALCRALVTAAAGASGQDAAADAWSGLTPLLAQLTGRWEDAPGREVSANAFHGGPAGALAPLSTSQGPRRRTPRRTSQGSSLRSRRPCRGSLATHLRPRRRPRRRLPRRFAG